MDVKPTILELSRLLREDPNLSPDDVGTERDVGSLDSDGDYEDLPDEEGHETFAGVARAMAGGSLSSAFGRGLTVRRATMDLIDRAIARYGSIRGALEHLSFIPVDGGEFEGARLELRGQRLVAYSGFEGRQVTREATSAGDLARAAVSLGSFVLKGMIQTLGAGSAHFDRR